MSLPTPSKRLGNGGRALWRKIAEKYELSDEQLMILEAACVQRDHDMELQDAAKNGDHKALREQRDSQMAMTRFLTALRLPDVKTGKRPQARTVREPQVRAADTANVTALDRALNRAG